MKEENKTTIQISGKLWKIFNDSRLKPSETFEEIILRLIKQKEERK